MFRPRDYISCLQQFRQLEQLLRVAALYQYVFALWLLSHDCRLHLLNVSKLTEWMLDGSKLTAHEPDVFE